MKELKPCPFCGSKDISLYEHEDFGGAFYVMCECCGANLGTTLDNMTLDEEEIANLWNTRVCAVSKKEPQTNEEWFCSLDTEDKAREISDMTAQGYWSEELVEEWLKQPRHNEVE